MLNKLETNDANFSKAGNMKKNNQKMTLKCYTGCKWVNHGFMLK